MKKNRDKNDIFGISSQIIKKGLCVGALALAMLICLVSCDTSSISDTLSDLLGGDVYFEVYNGTEPPYNNGQWILDGSSASNDADPIEQATQKDYELDKSESIKNENDKITSAGQAFGTVTEVWESIGDSVVEIRTEVITTDFFYGTYTSTGAGSGVIIDKDGYIVTNNHVIEGASTISVRLTDGSQYTATLVGTDEATDIAVIKIDPIDAELTAAPLGCSADLVVGEPVVAIGNPLGTLGGTVTTGIISATARSISVDNYSMVLLQTNAAINPGNSGGGLFNMAGQLIGVVNAKATGNDVEGLGFAIPIDTAYVTVMELVRYGYVRGVIDAGLTLYDVTSSTQQRLDVGVYIVSSEYSDELRNGDRIISVNGVEVMSSKEVENVLSTCTVGDTIDLVVRRNRRNVEVKLTLREYVPSYVQFEN